MDFAPILKRHRAAILALTERYHASNPRLIGSILHGNAFAEANPEIGWRSMRGMRNRVAHGYYYINLDVVWETVATSLPELAERLGQIKD